MNLNSQRLLSNLRGRFCCFLIHCILFLTLLGFRVWSLFVMQYLVSYLVLKPPHFGKESWWINCLLAVKWLLVFCLSSSWCRGLVCTMWMWYFLFILTFCTDDIALIGLCTKHLWDLLQILWFYKWRKHHHIKALISPYWNPLCSTECCTG